MSNKVMEVLGVLDQAAKAHIQQGVDASVQAQEALRMILDALANNNIVVGEGGGIDDAPDDDKDYVRNSGAWVQATDTDTVFPEAPADGQEYARKNGAWVEVTDTDTDTVFPEAPSDGKEYARQDGAWVEVTDTDTDTVFPEAPTDGKEYARKNSQWVEVTDTDTDTVFPEAPSDGKQYARQDGDWQEVVASGGGSNLSGGYHVVVKGFDGDMLPMSNKWVADGGVAGKTLDSGIACVMSASNGTDTEFLLELADAFPDGLYEFIFRPYLLLPVAGNKITSVTPPSFTFTVAIAPGGWLNIDCGVRGSNYEVVDKLVIDGTFGNSPSVSFRLSKRGNSIIFHAGNCRIKEYVMRDQNTQSGV